MEIVRLSVRYFHGYAMNQTAYGMLCLLYTSMGGGALPEEYFPSKGITVMPKGRTVMEAEQLLRRGSTPVIVRVTEEKLVLDLRTVLKEDYEILGRVCLLYTSRCV